jgi:hypothetical protein
MTLHSPLFPVSDSSSSLQDYVAINQQLVAISNVNQLNDHPRLFFTARC